MLEEVAHAFEKHGSKNCAELADRLESIVESHADEIEALGQSDRSAESRERMAKHKKRIDAAVETIVEHADRCRDEPRVGEALAKIL